MPSTPDPSIPPGDGTCHFLRLPRELRDEIYEYALTTPNGHILYRVYEVLQPNDGHYPTPSSARLELPYVGIEVNRLQYVSKQLRHETVGLTLKFNKTVEFMGLISLVGGFFDGCEQRKVLAESKDDLLKFLDICTHASISKLDTIVIFVALSTLCERKSAENCLFKICATHPHLTIIVRVIEWAIPGKYTGQSGFSAVYEFLEHGYGLEQWCSNLTRICAPAAKVWLAPFAEFQRFDERHVRTVISHYSLNTNAKEELLRKTKEWHKNGIRAGKVNMMFVDPEIKALFNLS